MEGLKILGQRLLNTWIFQMTSLLDIRIKVSLMEMGMLMELLSSQCNAPDSPSAPPYSRKHNHVGKIFFTGLSSLYRPTSAAWRRSGRMNILLHPFCIDIMRGLN